MTLGSPAPDQAQATNQGHRFELPQGDIALGRSQPKRAAPRRNGANQQMLRRVALGIATFAISLAVVGIAYRVFISNEFSQMVIENGTTSAIALLIGCFSLPASRRQQLGLQQNLLVCLSILAITPWTYQWGNRWADNGVDLATGFNFMFEVALAIVAYRLASRLSQNTAA